MRKLTLLLLLAAAAYAQSGIPRLFYVARTVTGTVNRITIKQPTSDARAIEFSHALVSCSVACTANITKNGTSTGGSAGTIGKLDDRNRLPASNAAYDATMGAEVTVVPTQDIVAGGSLSIENLKMYLPVVSGTQRQATVNVASSGSGTLTVFLVFSEPQ